MKKGVTFHIRKVIRNLQRSRNHQQNNSSSTTAPGDTLDSDGVGEGMLPHSTDAATAHSSDEELNLANATTGNVHPPETIKIEHEQQKITKSTPSALKNVEMFVQRKCESCR